MVIIVHKLYIIIMHFKCHESYAKGTGIIQLSVLRSYFYSAAVLNSSIIAIIQFTWKYSYHLIFQFFHYLQVQLDYSLCMLWMVK